MLALRRFGPPLLALLLACLCGPLPLTARAQDTSTDTASPPSPPRPRIALVLSGGGARGFAHVGVLRVLEQLRVPVDIVVGASMGAVVGGAYAAGRPVAELEAFVRETDWAMLVSDRASRQDLNFRRKEDDLEVPSRLELGLHRDGLSLPPSTATNAAVEDALARLLPVESRGLPVSALPLQFRAVATDLLTGDLVELKETPLLPSLRASMSVPGVFAPIRLGERVVVDGGLVRNLPVDLARAMGADIVIAVNVGTPLAGPETLGSAVGVAQQMLNILTEQNVQRSIRELGKQDILIAPDLARVSFLDFSAAATAMAAGETAARALAERLQPLSISPEQFASREVARTQRRSDPDMPRVLAKLEVRGTRWADARALAAESGLEEGEPVTRRDVERAAERLRGRGDFDRVGTEVRDTAAGREVVITPSESGWARSRVRLGLEFSSDFRDDNRFGISALHTLSWIDAWGGELRTLAKLGNTRMLASEWWQPLAAGSPWYASATLGYRAQNEDLYVNGQRVGRLSLAANQGTIAVGRAIGLRADLRVGLQRNVGSLRVLLPADTLERLRFGESNVFVQYRYDTLENLAFPTQGSLLTSRWERVRSGGPDEPSLANSQVLGLTAFRLGEWGGHVYAEWAKSADGFAPLALGGFWRLSGAPRDSINGSTALLGRVVFARRIGQMPAGIGGAVRAGLSFELGNAFPAEEAVRVSKLRAAGSAFVSVDTRFGPAYLALGASKGSSTVYVFLGPVW